MTELDDLTRPQRLLLKRAWTATREHPLYLWYWRQPEAW